MEKYNWFNISLLAVARLYLIIIAHKVVMFHGPKRCCGSIQLAKFYRQNFMMWLNLFSLVSLFICSAVVAAIVYFIFHSLMHTEQEIGWTATGKLSRRLGFFERYFLTVAIDSNVSHINTVLLLNSTVKLDPDHVKKALFMLLHRFPLLRMRVTVHEQPCFEEMKNPQILDFRSIDDVNSDDWQYAFEKQINGAPFSTVQGPLWRVALLTETCQSSGEENLYKNTLLFTFHHVIADALSVFELEKKLIEYLGMLYKGEAIDVETLPFRCPVEEAIKDFSRPNVLLRFMMVTVLTIRKLRIKMFSKSKPDNLYLSTFPPPQSHSVARTTCAVPRNLSREETMAVISCSKRNGCTVHGAITAATHLAMAKILQRKCASDSKIQSPLSINSTYTVNIRKECQPMIESEEFGLYASFDSLAIVVSAFPIEEVESFWEFARSCTNKVHDRIDSGKHHAVFKLFQCVDIPSFWAQSCYEIERGLQREIFNLTNLGALSIDEEGKSPYKFAGSYLAMQTAQVCNIFSHNIFTINGRLYWTGGYSPEITTKSQAEEFVDLSLRILMATCAS